MSNKYETGIYIITIFDKYGTKINSIFQSEGGLIRAQIEGEQLIKEMDGCHSFVITRVLHNSLDDR